MNPDKLQERVLDADTIEEYEKLIKDIGQYEAEVNANFAGKYYADKRSVSDLLDEAEETLDQGLSEWNESTVSGLLKEAIERISNQE